MGDCRKKKEPESSLSKKSIMLREESRKLRKREDPQIIRNGNDQKAIHFPWGGKKPELNVERQQKLGNGKRWKSHFDREVHHI